MKQSEKAELAAKLRALSQTVEQTEDADILGELVGMYAWASVKAGITRNEALGIFALTWPVTPRGVA